MTNAYQFNKIFSMRRQIGEGFCGQVFVCVEKATGKDFACKSISKSKLRTCPAVLVHLKNEVKIMYHLVGNPNVVSIKGVYEDDSFVHIVMELCSGGDLFDRICQHGRYAEAKAAKLFFSIVQVIHSLHSSGIMHRDIKPENFLFVNEKEDSPLKITDFGLSVFLKPGEKHKDLCGTKAYIAPEVYQGCYGQEADIWSAGVILYGLLAGYNPFQAETEEDMKENTVNRTIDLSLEPWPFISECAKDLVRRMLDRNPATRIIASEILCHCWFWHYGEAPCDHRRPCRTLPKKTFNFTKKIGQGCHGEQCNRQRVGRHRSQ